MASCWAGVRSPVTVAWVGTGTSPSPGVQVTWAVQSAPNASPLSTMYASNSSSMIPFMASYWLAWASSWAMAPAGRAVTMS